MHFKKYVDRKKSNVAIKMHLARLILLSKNPIKTQLTAKKMKKIMCH